MTDFAWTVERVEQLRALFAEGLSANWIAAKMGAPSRNAVVGKLHRLGLRRGNNPEAHVERIRNGLYNRAPRPPVARRAAFRAKPVRVKSPPVVAPPPITEPAGAHACGLLELTNSSCRWPVSGDGPPFMFCGEPEADFIHGVPYCRFHIKRAFRRPGEREEAA